MSEMLPCCSRDGALGALLPSVRRSGRPRSADTDNIMSGPPAARGLAAGRAGAGTGRRAARRRDGVCEDAALLDRPRAYSAARPEKISASGSRNRAGRYFSLLPLKPAFRIATNCDRRERRFQKKMVGHMQKIREGVSKSQSPITCQAHRDPEEDLHAFLDDLRPLAYKGQEILARFLGRKALLSTEGGMGRTPATGRDQDSRQSGSSSPSLEEAKDAIRVQE